MSPATQARQRKAKKARLARRGKYGAPDCLLDRHEAGAMLCMSPERFPRYAERFQKLRDGQRIVRVDARSAGRARWTMRSVLAHLDELLTPEINDGSERGAE